MLYRHNVPFCIVRPVNNNLDNCKNYILIFVIIDTKMGQTQRKILWIRLDMNWRHFRLTRGILPVLGYNQLQQQASEVWNILH